MFATSWSAICLHICYTCISDHHTNFYKVKLTKYKMTLISFIIKRGEKSWQLQLSVNWRWCFHIAVEHFWLTLLCGIVSTGPHQRGFRAWTACLRSPHSISVGIQFGRRLGRAKPLYFVFNKVDPPERFRSLSCSVTQVLFSLRPWADGRMFPFKIFWKK